MPEPTPLIVTLTPDELREAAAVGVERMVQNVELGTKQRRMALVRWRNRFSYDIVGAAGERAVAKLLGITWNGCLGNWKASDVGPFQVRCRQAHHYDLSLYKDQDDAPPKFTVPFILVTIEDPTYQEYQVRGWAYGYEIMTEEFWGEPDTPRWSGGPCWLYPTSELFDMDKLPITDFPGWFLNDD